MASHDHKIYHPALETPQSEEGRRRRRRRRRETMRIAFPIFFIVLLFFLSSYYVSADLTLIIDACKKYAADERKPVEAFCVESLKAGPGSLTADLQGLGVISVQLALANATQTEFLVQQLRKNTTEPYVQEALKDCDELYSSAISLLSDSIRAFESKRYGDVNAWISAVLDSASTCEDGFQERKGIISPLTRQNEDLEELSAIALSIATSLH